MDFLALAKKELKMLEDGLLYSRVSLVSGWIWEQNVGVGRVGVARVLKEV